MLWLNLINLTTTFLGILFWTILEIDTRVSETKVRLGKDRNFLLPDCPARLEIFSLTTILLEREMYNHVSYLTTSHQFNHKLSI